MTHVTTVPRDTYDASPAALRPLMETFWSPQGWRRLPAWPTPAVLAQAVSAGVMFEEPEVHDHDEWVDKARQAAMAVSAEAVGDAFLESLSTRRLDLRSALGSYAIARVLPQHAFTPVSRALNPNAVNLRCEICGRYSPYEQDLNVLNFERFKWGRRAT